MLWNAPQHTHTQMLYVSACRWTPTGYHGNWMARRASRIWSLQKRKQRWWFYFLVLHYFLFTPLAPSCILDSFQTFKLLIAALTPFLLEHNRDFVYLARNLKSGSLKNAGINNSVFLKTDRCWGYYFRAQCQ